MLAVAIGRPASTPNLLLESCKNVYYNLVTVLQDLVLLKWFIYHNQFP